MQVPCIPCDRGGTQFGKMLSFLYVGGNQEDWIVEELTGKTTMYIIEDGWDKGEFGDVHPTQWL